MSLFYFPDTSFDFKGKFLLFFSSLSLINLMTLSFDFKYNFLIWDDLKTGITFITESPRSAIFKMQTTFYNFNNGFISFLFVCCLIVISYCIMWCHLITFHPVVINWGNCPHVRLFGGSSTARWFWSHLSIECETHHLIPSSSLERTQQTVG